MSKAHTITLMEAPVVTTGGLRIEINCPSGCVKGYIWGDDAELIRSMARAMRSGHEIDKGPTD